jgi:hypothetical protein
MFGNATQKPNRTPDSKKRPRPGNVTHWRPHLSRHQISPASANLKGEPFLKERSWNVVENKGPLWKTWERSWNVYENTGLVAVGHARRLTGTQKP